MGPRIFGRFLARSVTGARRHTSQARSSGGEGVIKDTGLAGSAGSGRASGLSSLVVMSLTSRLLSTASRPYVRLAVLSAAAAAAAYGIGTALAFVSPVVAAITALVTVRPTLHGSMQEALRQVLGVVIGAAVAFASLEMIGYSALTLFVGIVTCFVAAAWLRLGEDGAAAVAVTVILVVGPHFSSEAIETRLFGAVVGSLLALLTSYFTRPGTPHGRALTEVVDEAGRTAALLAGIADTLSREGGQVPAHAYQGDGDALGDAHLLEYVLGFLPVDQR